MMSATMSESCSAKLDSSKDIKGCNVQVAVRCRPMNGEERKAGQASCVTCDSENKSIKVAYGPVGKKIMKNFSFDKVFGMYSRQEEVFDSVVRPIVEETLAGFNCTIFAYGQTGTGKTHTMEGNINSEEDAGIVPRSVNAILQQLEASGAEFTIRVSFLELYNEELQDLLNTTGEKKLKLCEDVKKGVICQNLEEIAVLNASDIFEILQRGIQQRQTAATLCNKNSSRSHSIFTMKIMIKECNIEGEEVVRHGQLNLVDLAGSECIGRSGAKNDRAREAGSINQSLLTLGRVITALVDHHGHVPYRDSKLTRLLQESLGGKAKTCIIATFSPAQAAVEETMSTLDYAYRAKSIKNQPTVNQKLTKKVIMKEYFAEIETLRSQLFQTREKNGVYVDPAEFYAMETRLAAQDAQIVECESALRSRAEELKSLRNENEQLSDKLSESLTALSQSQSALSQAEHQRDVFSRQLQHSVQHWQASERVICEQQTTEESLLDAGQRLQSQVRHGEMQGEKLMAKMLALEAHEARRFSSTQSFLNSLAQKHSALRSSVDSMSQQHAQSARQIAANVSLLLQRGTETCTTMQNALSGALQVLVNESELARSDLSSHCQQLNGCIHQESEHQANQIRSLSVALNVWADEVTQQLTAAHEVAFGLSQQCELWSRDALHLADTSKQDCLTFRDDIRNWNSDFQAQLQIMQQLHTKEGQEFEQQLEVHRQQAEKEFVLHIDASQRLMRDSFDQLLESHRSVMQRTSKFGQSFVRTQQEQAHDRFQTIHSMLTKGTSMCESSSVQQLDHFDKMQCNSQSQCVRTSTDCLSLGKTVDSVCDSLNGKKRALETDASSLCEAIEVQSKRLCLSVDEASTNAQATLRRVNESSQIMSASVSQAVANFTETMECEGRSLTNEIKKQRLSAENCCTEQGQALDALEKREQEFGDQLQSDKLDSTGDTPRKVVVNDTIVLDSTRMHTIIRREAIELSETQTIDEIDALLSFADHTLQQKEELLENEISVTHRDSVGSFQSWTSSSSRTAVDPLVNENDLENTAPAAANVAASLVMSGKVTTRRSASKTLTRTRSGIQQAEI